MSPSKPRKGKEAQTFMGLRSVRPRKAPPRVVVLHWTGGTNGLDVLYLVLRGTKGPRTQDGLSVHFGVAPDGESRRWADDSVVCLHAGFINDDSLGIEICSPGYSTGKPWERESKRGVKRVEYVDKIRGIRVRMVDFTEAQLATVATLVETWCDTHGIPRDFPREADGTLMRRQMTTEEAAAFRGVAGHYHFHPMKNDPGTRIFLFLACRWGIALA